MLIVSAAVLHAPQFIARQTLGFLASRVKAEQYSMHVSYLFVYRADQTASQLLQGALQSIEYLGQGGALQS